jgi:hypothetical protein
MPEKQEHQKVCCPYCSWCRRSFLLPAHLITRHIKHVNIRKGGSTSYLPGYIQKGEEEIDFRVCLSCKKGIMNDGFERNGLRWVNMHDKRKECSKMHDSLLADFKLKKKECEDECIIMNKNDTPNISIIDISCQTNTIDNLWNNLKNKKRLKTFMNDIEKSYEEFYSDESDNYIFDTSVGFEDCIASAIGYKNDNLQKIDEIKQLHEQIESYKNKIEQLTCILSEKQNTH